MSFLSARGGMTAAVLVKAGALRFERRPIPIPGPGEALVRLRVVGICGSDVHYYTEGRLAGGVITSPLVLGHEAAGEVVAIGKGVRGLAPGDRVCVEPAVSCGACSHCRSGRYNLCHDARPIGTPRGGTHDGAFREYMTHPAAFVFKLPANVDFENGALVEPFSVGMHACRQAGLAMGQSVLIYGAGPIGLCALLAAHAAGAGRVAITDPRPDRLETAKRLGADCVYPSPAQAPADAFDAVLECSGAAPALADCPRAVAPGGVITQVGMFVDSAPPIDLIQLMRKEASLATVWRFANTYPTALSLLASRRVSLRPLVTHRLPFARLVEAIELARAGRPGTIKVVVEFPAG